ncbi:MAG TPA: DoxX family membrane protein [Bryobacteraceae bacterium]|nr:DoxX family membrane protein [Bryobacteraceae bacterium]
MNDSVRIGEQMGSLSTADDLPPARYSDAVVAYTVLRLTFGANIMLHGVSRLFAGHAAFLGYLNHYFEKTPLIPAAFLPVFATVLPPVEGTLGLLLLLGLATRFSLIAGALVVTALAIGTNLAQDWNVAGLQLIYAFLYYQLLLRRKELNRLSIDGWRSGL